MPTIDEIIRVAEALDKSPVIVVADRCAAVRNRNSKCRKCSEACPADAIAIMANKVELDPRACMGCGCCSAACPNEALVFAKPTDTELAAKAASTIDLNDGTAVVACARIASKRKADPARFAEIPCVSRFDEVLGVDLVARGADAVLLVDGNCGTCKNRACAEAADFAVEQANALLETHGSQVRITRLTGFPEDMLVQDSAGMYGSSRRGFFTEAMGNVKETAKVAAKTTIEAELGYKIDERSIGERLRVGEDGKLPQIEMKRHERALNALDRIGAPESGVIESRLFGSIDIDTVKCNICGMCVTFCPTRALKRNPCDKPSERIRYFEFSAADCVQCGLCQDVCWKSALKMSTAVDVAELYDFEPRIFHIEQP